MAGPTRTDGGAARSAALLAGLLGCLGTATCVHQMSEIRTAPGTAPSPGVPWSPPASAAAPTPAPAPVIPPDLLEEAGHWGLADLVDLALRTNPDTRIAWAQARAAAADLGAKRGAYYPAIALQDNYSKIRGSAVGGKFTFKTTTQNPYVTVSYLLFDIGGRTGSIEEARQALIAANGSHNATIQDQVLKVELAYYQYLYARALEQAEEAAVKEAQASLDAASRRHEAGVGTIADVLQAKTALSQSRLALETVQGQIQTIHGVLATAVGLPANTPFDVVLPEGSIPAQQAAEEVERLIAEAQALRPDLAAARAVVLQKDAHTLAIRALGLPSLTTSFNGGTIFYPQGIQQDTYTAGLLLTIPVFNGLTYNYNVIKARAETEEAQARVDSLRQLVVYQVWSSYYNHKTAAQKVETIKDLLESARQSFDVASGRYQAGVGSILDLLTAESALENARAQEAQARTEWFMTLAQLAHDTGTLWRPTASGTRGTP